MNFNNFYNKSNRLNFILYINFKNEIIYYTSHVKSILRLYTGNFMQIFDEFKM